MFRGFIVGIIFTVLAAAAVGYYALRSGLIPANADAKPGQIERFIAGTSLQATLDKNAPKESNPVQLTDEESRQRHQALRNKLRDLPRHSGWIAHLVGNEYILDTSAREDFGLRNLLAADPNRPAELLLQAQHVYGFVHLPVRAVAHVVGLGIVAHLADVALERIEIED